MMMRVNTGTLLLTTGCLLTLPFGHAAEPTTSEPNAAAESIAAKGATLEKLGDGFSFTEGPTADAQGNVFFTDQPNDRIHKWSVDGEITLFLEPAGRSNGMDFDKAGNLWSCADAKNELWMIKPDGSHEVVVTDYEGKLLNGPNDVWIHPSGAIYFSDPYYKRPYWDRGPSEQTTAVYRLSSDHKTLTRVDDDFERPNGLVGTPDGKTLYVADIGAKKTYAYDIADDGSLTNKRLFCEQGSDGMTIDVEGRVYLTGNGVSVFDRDGNKVEQIDVPEPWTANICFGGKDRSMLFMTAGKRVYGLQTRTQGTAAQ